MEKSKIVKDKDALYGVKVEKQKKRIVKDKDALMGVKVEKAMSGKMMGGGHKNYKMSGKIK